MFLISLLVLPGCISNNVKQDDYAAKILSAKDVAQLLNIASTSLTEYDRSLRICQDIAFYRLDKTQNYSEKMALLGEMNKNLSAARQSIDSAVFADERLFGSADRNFRVYHCLRDSDRVPDVMVFYTPYVIDGENLLDEFVAGFNPWCNDHEKMLKPLALAIERGSELKQSIHVWNALVQQ